MNAVDATGLTLTLGGRAVLSGVDLRIAPGEFVGVLGPNGAGKTTFLRAILGLIRPTRGSLRVFGAAARPGEAPIGYLPQVRAGQPARITGHDAVASVVRGARLGLPSLGRAARAEAARALRMVDADALADRPLAELSGGERQRILLAQALVGRPRLLLLDEPLASLDPHHQADVVSLAKSLQTDHGMTVLFTAHDLNPLLPAMDRVLYLGGGAAALGTVEQVVTEPVLSRLYGAEIEVLHVGGRIFVMSAAHGMAFHDQCAHAHA